VKAAQTGAVRPAVSFRVAIPVTLAAPRVNVSAVGVICGAVTLTLSWTTEPEPGGLSERVNTVRCLAGS